MTPFQAAIEGTKEIGPAVMATTLSLLAVFLPVGFMGGIVGRFMSSFGFTSGFSIAVSLLVSFTLTPMLCSRFVKALRNIPATSHDSKESRSLQVARHPLHNNAHLGHGSPQNGHSRQRAHRS